MIIDYYKTDVVVVDAVLGKGIEAGAYDQAAGWTYRGLISVSRQYGLDGEAYDLGKMGMNVAFNQLETYLSDGPVIASIHYKFNPKSRVPHLVVITGIKNGMVYYNDPAAKIGGKQISVADFEKGWKKRFIVLRPTKISGPVALTGWHPHTSRL